MYQVLWAWQAAGHMQSLRGFWLTAMQVADSEGMHAYLLPGLPAWSWLTCWSLFVHSDSYTVTGIDLEKESPRWTLKNKTHNLLDLSFSPHVAKGDGVFLHLHRCCMIVSRSTISPCFRGIGIAFIWKYWIYLSSLLGAWHWTQGIMHAKQTFYHQSSSNPSYLVS